MKKILSLTLAVVMAAGLVACGNSGSSSATETTESAAETTTAAESATEEASGEKPETITIQALNANAELSDIEVPYDPQRIAILDLACLDILDNLGLGDRVVGCANTTIDYLQSYVEDENIVNLGTIKEADLEAVMACEPEIIFIGGRLSASYDALSEIAPVVYIATDTEKGLIESVRDNATTVASIFGREDEIAEKLEGFDNRIAALAEFAEGKTAVVGMCTSGSFNVLGNDGRCSIIGREIGFDNLGADVVAAQNESGSGRSGRGGNSDTTETTAAGENAETAEGSERSGRGGHGSGEGGENSQGGGTATHGNEASFELIVSLNPDYIFVMDRDAAIGTDGAQLAQEIMENELVMGTDAYKNGNIVYLEHPGVWYTAEGGITALDYMLVDLESALLN